MVRPLQLACYLALLSAAANFDAPTILAADADKGKHIAQMRCAPCQIGIVHGGAFRAIGASQFRAPSRYWDDAQGQ